MHKLLTKSKYLLGLQCPKLLWKTFNDKESLPEQDISAKHKMEQGTLVGELATKVFKDGIDLADLDYGENIKKTQEALKKRKPIFEAGIEFKCGERKLFSRGDILNPVGKDEWDIIEVKSSTKVKDVNISDVSFQKQVYEKSGLKIRKCFLMHINNQYVKKGKINPKKLFVQEDISEEVEKEMKGIEDRMKNMFKIIDSKKQPEICIGTYCKDPYSCQAMEECWRFLPDDNVFNLYRAGKKAFDLYDIGVTEIKDIPEDHKLTEKQEIQKKCSVCNKEHVDKKAIKTFLEGLTYPLYYLDFETFSPAIPRFDGTRPYQQIPFQFSLHIQKTPKSTPEHISFLAEGREDPRPAFMEALKKHLGTKGDIIVYNESFEKARIKEGIEAFPEFEKWGEKILRRVVDLLHPFRNFHFYHPKQKGSASIKYVLPVLSDLSYKGMQIDNGMEASIEYERVTFGKFGDEKIKEMKKKGWGNAQIEGAWGDEVEKVRNALEKYCELDTWAEVEIVKRLGEIVK